MATQWHTAFAYLLRPIVEEFYDVDTNVPVGDLPREADIVLLRRTAHPTPPFHGLWRRLTEWNVLEYKGPSVSARQNDVDFLVELGLGIHRRLNDQRKKAKKDQVPASEVSFWYLASRLGRGFLEALARRGVLPPNLGPAIPGVWEGVLLDHPMYFVSTLDLPVELDCLPFHLLGVDTTEKKDELARLVRTHPRLEKMYKDAWASLHPAQLQEFLAMARNSKKGVTFHLMPLVELIGWKEAIHQLGCDQLVDQLAADENQRKKTMRRLLEHLSESEKAELMEQLSPKKTRRT